MNVPYLKHFVLCIDPTIVNLTVCIVTGKSRRCIFPFALVLCLESSQQQFPKIHKINKIHYYNILKTKSLKLKAHVLYKKI